jgi:hypothetical protein
MFGGFPILLNMLLLLEAVVAEPVRLQLVLAVEAAQEAIEVLFLGKVLEEVHRLKPQL